jgi:hypothetical protein
MPLLPGMKGEGYYDRHSSLQRASFDAYAGWIPEAVGRMPLPAEPQPITIADYGCSEGQNSIHALNIVTAAVRACRPRQAICAIHTDLPTNNFNQLFRNLHDPSAANYLQQAGQLRGDTFALAAAGSFYGRLLPARSVHFALSLLALEWMDQVPAVPVPEFISYVCGSEAAREAFARQARRDLIEFFRHRAAELALGARLLLVFPGRDARHCCSTGLYDLLDDACRDLVRAGRIDPASYERFVMPVYFRSVDDVRSVVDDAASPVHGLFTIEQAEAREVPPPFQEHFRQNRDVPAFATAFTGFLRAISEPVLAAGLAAPGGGPVAIQALYERIHERVLADPDRYAFINMEVGMLLSRSE